MTNSQLTGTDNYFENFSAGMKMRHARGKTVEPLENVLITNMVMNTADAHFNKERMTRHPLGERIVFGGITSSIVIGLASQDASDNMVTDRGIKNMKLLSPVVHGDTIFAYSQVLSLQDLGEASGVVEFHHWGVNQHGTVVCEVDRTVEVRKRSAATANSNQEGGK